MNFLNELLAMRPDLIGGGAMQRGTLGSILRPGVQPLGAYETPGINPASTQPGSIQMGGPANDWQPVSSLPPVGPAQDAMPQRPPKPRSPRGPIADLAPNTPTDFDYDGAAEMVLGQPPRQKGQTLRDILTVLGPAIMAGFGNEQGANQLSGFLMRNREDQQQRRHETIRDLAQRRWQDWKAKNQADLDASAPFSSGRDRVQYDPVTGQSRVIYDGKEDFETYATSLGLTPGTDAYNDAQQDYVMRANGPSAFARNKSLDDYRTDNDIRAEGVRAANRSKLKSQPTYADTHGRPGRSGGGKGVPTATGPNGQQIFYRGGKWVDVQGRPVG